MKVWTIVLVTCIGCIRAPAVSIVDRRTSLEIQAAGEYRALENDLIQAGLSPAPAMITRGEIETITTTRTSFDEVVEAYQAIQLDSEIIDSLLIRRCIGEGLDGLLVETPSTCVGDTTAFGPLVERVNRNRRQMWRFLAQLKPDVSEEAIRRAWRETHLSTVVCNGQVQQADGSWGVKECAD